MKSGVDNSYHSLISTVCSYEKHKYYWDLKNFIYLNFYTVPVGENGWYEMHVLLIISLRFEMVVLIFEMRFY